MTERNKLPRNQTTDNPCREGLALVESRHNVSPLREVNGSRSFAGPHDIYGGSKERLLASLKRLTRAGEVQRKSLTSLTVFHLVEMELLARDDSGKMRVTPLGERTLQDYERDAQRRDWPGDTPSPPSLFTVR